MFVGVNIVQISDTHFGTEWSEVENALVECLQTIQPDTVLLTGDVTQRAKRSQFARARQFLKRLPAHNLAAIPGNHDIPLYNLWRRIFKPYQGFLRAFQETEVIYANEACTIIGIDTTSPTRHKDGVITAEQIAWVTGELKKNSNSRLRIVAAHHPLAVVLPSDKKNLTANAEEAVQAWSAAGMDLILGGHIHYPFMAPLSGHFPHISTNAWVMQAGTAVSRRVRSRKPNSFNRIVVTDKRATARIEQWDYKATTGQFEVVETLTPWT